MTLGREELGGQGRRRRRRLSETARRRLHQRRIRSLENDGFTPDEADYYTGFNWPISTGIIMRLRRRRRTEIRRLRRRGFSENEIFLFFQRQWDLTNEDVLSEDLIDERYQQEFRPRRAA